MSAGNPGDPVRRALEALAGAARERLARHPQGHLVGGARTDLELRLKVPLVAGGAIGDDAVAEARLVLEGEIDALLSHRAAFQPGRVFCLRCSSAGCEHAAPDGARQVFAGYSPSGVPRFLDFGQWLLERKHPDLDRLFRKPPQLVTAVTSGRDLARDLLPAFRDARNDYRIHGQVSSGWFPVPGAGGVPEMLALTFQVVSSAGRRKQKGKGRRRRRLALNVLGAGPGGEPLAELYLRLPAIPWASVVEWSQSVLQSIERSQGRKSATPELLSRRIEGVLNNIARRLAHDQRSRRRRTSHAQQRHETGDRPTRMALRDLARAGSEGFLVDERRRTTIVLGARGRAHVWNADGKLVTSIRYSPDSIERKKQKEIWRPARAEEVVALRKTVGIEALQLAR